MKKIIIAVALFIGFIILVASCSAIASSGNDSASTTSNGDPAAKSSESNKSTESAKPKTDGKLADGGWVVESQTLKNDGLGSFGGTARITNTNDGTESGLFTLTVFKAGKQVASLTGSSSDVEAGKTVTVTFISSDKYVSGPYTYDFQNDF